MREATFPQPVSTVVATLADIFRHQGRTEVVELLESAHAYFDETEYDNWNGGTYSWALRLEVPVHIFASVEPRLSSIEKEISAKLTHFDRQYPNDHLGEVTTTPITAGALPFGQRMAPSDIEVRRLWLDGRFRLFLSHVSRHKVAVSSLKEALWLCGVDAFVAHEDIEPSLDWQREIELGLRSMHALAAIITPDFHNSRWTDQEVGWALGRGIPVVPVRLGADPYGLAGRFQGVSGNLEQPGTLAEAIVKTLVANPQTHGEMRRALINAFTKASSCDMAKVLCGLMATVTDITDEERDALWRACTDNAQVANTVGVPDVIYAAFGTPPAPQPNEVHDDIPF
jgi:hypothetical protein